MPEDIRELSASLTAQATQIHANFSEPGDTFVDYLCSLPLSHSELSELRIADLYLARCCLLGNKFALELFWTKLVPGARRAAFSVTKNEEQAEDVMQEVLQKLIVGSPEKPPTLSSYQGKSKLERWLRSVTIRAAISNTKKFSPQNKDGDDDDLLRLPAIDDDPELALIKESSGEMVEQALHDSLREMDHSTRLVLQQNMIDGLSIDQLAIIYRIHRATAARRVAKAREELLASTRQKLRTQMQQGGRDIDSLIAFAQSRVKLSLRWFAATVEP